MTNVGSSPPALRTLVTQAGRGGLAVRAGHRDSVAEPHDLAEHLGPRDDRNLAFARRLELGIAGRNGRRDHDHVAVLHMLRVMAGVDPDAESGQPPGHLVRVQVRPADLETEGMQDLRDPAPFPRRRSR